MKQDDQGRKPWQDDYGLGEHSIDGDALGLMDEQELTERLVQTFEAPNYRPPRLPAVATELLALSQKPDVEFSQVEALLERDAVLAGEILSMARSTFYARKIQVDSLHDALLRLGLGTLRDIVYQATMNLRVFRSNSYKGCMDRLRRHCQATAHLSRIISSYAPSSGERSFLCGLLHDVGIAGILLMLGDVPRGKKAPDLTVLWPAIDAAHAKAGARMVELWGLPKEIVGTVRNHHFGSAQGLENRLVATVCLAEMLATEVDMAFVPKQEGGAETKDLVESGLILHGGVDGTDPGSIARAKEALGLEDATIEQIRSIARGWAMASETAGAPV